MRELDEAAAAYGRGDYAGAERLCREVVGAHPEVGRVWYLLGMIAHRRGEAVEAAGYLKRAVELGADDAQVQAHAAEIFRRAGWLDEAVGAGRRAVGLSPGEPATHNNLGMALQDRGDLREAEGCFRRAVEVDGGYERARHNLGNVLTRQGRVEEAGEVLRAALELNPENPQALNAMGVVLSRQHKHREAIAVLGKAVSLRPGYKQALLNLGNAYTDVGRLDEAERCLRELLERHGGYALGWHDLGALLEKRGRLVDALGAYGRSVAIDPGFDQSFAALENVKRRLCDWGGRPGSVDRLLGVVRGCLGAGRASPLWPLASLRFATTPADRLGIARGYAGPIAARVRGREVYPGVSGGGAGSRLGTPSRLTVGFLSHEFRHCVVSHLMAGLFGRFDRGRFRVVGLDYSADDGSELRRQVTGDCDAVVPLGGLTGEGAARRIADEGVQVLVDINSYMPGGRPEIAAHRPAPVQVSYMYPATMGAPWIDYFLTDSYVTPSGHERWFTEELVYLPGPYLPTNRDQAIAGDGPSRAACGLPAVGFVYCSFNHADKIEPELFDVWMRVLRGVPGSVLWQRCDDEVVKRNLRREAGARGVDPGRLVFAGAVPGSAEHLARHRHADLFLDTLTHGGHGTAVDALWAGVPVLACPGETFTSRVSSSLLSAAGLGELIAGGVSEYERIAVELGGDAGRLRGLRERVDRARLGSAVFDTGRLVRGLEAAFEAMWERRVAGLGAGAIRVGGGG